MKVSFNCSKHMLFPFTYSLTKIPFIYFKAYTILLYSDRTAFCFFLNELVPFLVFLVLAIISRYQLKSSKNIQTNTLIIGDFSMSIIKPKRTYNICLHILLLSICAAISFLESFFYVTEATLLIAIGPLFIFSIIFTKLMFKTKWFRHQWVGFVIIFLFSMVNITGVFLSTINYVDVDEELVAFEILIYLQLGLIVLIPLRGILEKYLIDRHYINLFDLLALENLFCVLSRSFYLINSSRIILEMTLEMFGVIVGYIILVSANQYLGLKTIQTFDPNYKYLGDSIVLIVVIVIINQFEKPIVVSDFYDFILNYHWVIISLLIIYFFGNFLYVEVIIIYYCGLETNTKKEITKRSQLETNKDIEKLIEFDAVGVDNRLNTIDSLFIN